MNEAKVAGLLGMAMRIGIVITGEDACVDKIRKKQAAIVLVDEDASENATKRYTNACFSHQAQMATLPKGMLARAIGKDGRMALVITKHDLASKLIELTDAQIPV